MRILQGGLVRWYWKGLDTKGHKKGINDWKGSQVIMQAMIVLTQKNDGHWTEQSVVEAEAMAAAVG